MSWVEERPGVVTLQDIFRSWLEQHAADYSLHPAAKRYVQGIADCGTFAVPGMAYECPADHITHVRPGGCRIRFCPNCARTTEWIAKQRARMLDVPHHHLVLTVPHDITPLWRYNRRAINKIVLRTGVQVVAAEARRQLGLRLGLLAGLHTAGETIVNHLHDHIAASAGGLDDSGRWVDTPDNLFPDLEAVRRRFQRLAFNRIIRFLASDKSNLPSDLPLASLTSIVESLRDSDQNWRIWTERYDTVDDLLGYIGRKLHAGPIAPHQIVSFDGKIVTFRYRENRTSSEETMELALTDFVGRLIDHAACLGQHLICSTEIYATNGSDRLDDARTALLEHRNLPPPTPPLLEQILAPHTPPPSLPPAVAALLAIARDRFPVRPIPVCCAVCGLPARPVRVELTSTGAVKRILDARPRSRAPPPPKAKIGFRPAA